MINELITDVTETSRANIVQAAPASIDDIRASKPLIAFSPRVFADAVELKRFLHKELYRHYRVLRMANKAKRIVSELFVAFQTDPNLLPTEHAEHEKQLGARAIADYIAGMTDRYAVREHVRLFAIEN
jgi:dGTPase